MKESLGSALRGFCMLSKGYNRSFIDKGWALRVAFRQYALLKNDAFTVMDYRTSLYLSMPETRSAQGRRYFSPW